MEHNYQDLGEKGQGENLGWLSPVKPKCSQAGQTNCYTCSEIIDTWYQEMNNYDFKIGTSKQGSIEHFVQVCFCVGYGSKSDQNNVETLEHNIMAILYMLAYSAEHKFN